jgi:hypothetical protein
MRIDFTLTLPGLFEIAKIQDLATQWGVDILAKVVFSFTPDIIMSPLALPRQLLDQTINRIVPDTSGALRDVLVQLKHRPTFQEQWPSDYAKALAKGKARMLHLESIRQDKFGMTDILSQDDEILAWWNQIDCSSHT